MRHYAGLFAAINEGKRSVELDLKDADGPRQGARAGGGGRRARGGIPPRGPGPAGRRRVRRAPVEPRHRLLLDLRLRATRSSCGPARPRRQLPRVVGRTDARRRHATSIPPLPTADLAAGMTAAFGICAAVPGAGHQRRRGDTRHLHDRRAGHMDRPRRRPAPATRVPGTPRGRRSRATASSRRRRGQVALGVLNEQHFWASLCAELGLDAVAALDFDDPLSRRAEELQQAVGRGHRRRSPATNWSPGSSAAGVPVAPVLDRQGMLAAAPVPPLPDPPPAPRSRRGPSRPSTSTGARALRAG